MLYTLVLSHSLCLQKETKSLLHVHVALVQMSRVTPHMKSKEAVSPQQFLC